MQARISRFMLTAPNSGAGKTTVTCAVLKALMLKGLRPAAFKAGPDYIDPMFHSRVVGADSRNLDEFLLGADTCRYLLAKNAAQADLAVLEGAMGYYDGMGTTTAGSAYSLAALTETPVVLVVDVKGAALSAAALIKGFREFRSDSNIKGAILNNVTPMTYAYYKEVIESECGVRLYGYLPRMEDCSFGSRHLGLVTAEEITDWQDIVARLAAQALKTIELDSLVALAQTAPPVAYEAPLIKKIAKVKIAVALDRAFCFYYRDALELLAELGADLVEFSPLTDQKLPACDGLILGGGYPELYAGKLAGNKTMLADIRGFVQSGKPCFAECGGFMYLLENFVAADNKVYTWVGALKGKVAMTKQLTRFGYLTLTSKNKNLLADCGEQINAHEFHYSDSTDNGSAFYAEKVSRQTGWPCIHGTESLYAGYPHIHLWGNPRFAERFVQACVTAQNRQDDK